MILFFFCRADYITKKMNGEKLSSHSYLTEAEPFLKRFAERSLRNKKLVGAACVDICADEFLAIEQGGEDGYISEGDHVPAAAIPTAPTSAIKAQGMLVFFPGTYYIQFVSVAVYRTLPRKKLNLVSLAIYIIS